MIVSGSYRLIVSAEGITATWLEQTPGHRNRRRYFRDILTEAWR